MLKMLGDQLRVRLGDDTVEGALFLIYQESSDISGVGTFHGFNSLL